MRIWILNHYASPPDRPIGTRHYDLGTRLAARGHDITIFASSFGHRMRQGDRLNPGESWRADMVGGVRFVWVRTTEYEGNGAGRLRNMLSYCHRTPEAARGMMQPDVIVGSSVHPFAALTAYSLARKLGCAFVFEVRDLWPQTLVDMGVLSNWHPLTLVLRAVERFLYRQADRVISLLPLAHQYIESHGGRPGTVVWIPNGVDLNRFPMEDDSTRNTLDSFTLLYLGSHGKANALDTILQAGEHLKQRDPKGQVRFVLVGEGPEKPRLLAEASRLGLQNLQFQPGVAKAHIAPVLRQADACVVSTNEIGVYRFGISFNKLFDYLAAAKPILFAGSVPANPVEESGAGIIVPAGNAAALAEAALQLAHMVPAERRAMGLRGRAYVEESFDWDQLAPRFLDCLIAACDTHRMGRRDHMRSTGSPA